MRRSDRFPVGNAETVPLEDRTTAARTVVEIDMCSGTGKIFAGIDRHALHEIFAVLREVAYCSATLTDTNGNMTSDGTNTYEWDAENRLIKINYPGISNYTQFTFDSLGRNTKTVETSSGSVTSTKQNLWSTNLRQEERDGSGSLTRQYFTSGRASISSGSSTNYFYTADHLGSVRELLDSSGGPQAQYAYSPFGGKTNMLDEAASADFQFTGFYLHERSNLSLTKFRAFHSQLGRWLSRDPMGQNTENNQFAYCLNDPVQNIDPSGLWLTPAQVEAKAGEIMKMLEAGDNKSRYLSNNFVLCQIYNESTFDPESESGAGAKGMMGVTRIGALQVGSKMSEMGIPNKNIRAGTRIDDYFIDQNKGDIQRGIIQYSGGHGKPYYDHIKACECCLNKRDKDKAKGKNTASLYECLEKAKGH